MKTRILLTCITTACFAAALQVSAQPTPITSSASGNYQAVNTFALPNNGSITAADLLLGHGESDSGTFNIESAGGNNTTTHDVSGPIAINPSPSSVTISSDFAGLGAGNIYSDVAGFNSSLSQVTSGTINIWIKDSDNTADEVSVSLSGGGNIFSGSAGSATYDFTAGSLDSGAITLLNENGQFSYSIENTGTGDASDFTVDYAVLQVDTSPVNTPDGGSTGMLLGAALTALAGFNAARRQKS
jgi:hypothetical protein